MVEAADMTQDVKAAHNALANHNEIDGSITAMFQQIGKGVVKYGHHQLTRAKIQYNLYSLYHKWISDTLSVCGVYTGSQKTTNPFKSSMIKHFACS